MRIALVYDCLYPHTIGGAERWLHALAAALAREHDVTYVTRRQWASGERLDLPGVECLAVSPSGPLYDREGRRRLLPPALFGAGVLLHFVRHRRRYDVVHCLSYPYLPFIAVRLALAGRRDVRIYCEWLECLTDAYWRAYGGRIHGLLGGWLQAICVRLTERAFVFSGHTERRLRESGFRGELHRLGGLWAGSSPACGGESAPPEALVLFAGRHVPDKRVAVLPEAIAHARTAFPELRGIIVGDGPERPRVLERIRALGLQAVVRAPGFLARRELDCLYRRAACVVSPSVRDGYGMVVAEAAAAGAPVVVCHSPDNAAVERVEEGVNGWVAASPSPGALGDAIVKVLEGGEQLRRSCRRWFREHCRELSMASSIDRVAKIYKRTEPAGDTGLRVRAG